MIRAHPLRSMSGQVAVLIASLSFVPNLVLIVITLLRAQPEQIPVGWTIALGIWVVVLGILSAGVGFWSAHLMLRPLLNLAREVAYLESVLDDPERWTLVMRPQDPQEALILRGAISQLLHRLRLAQEQRAAFTATLMHDLKTPLVAFRHLLTALQAPTQTAIPPEQQQDLLRQLLQENERILELVQRMVEVHRFEQRQIQLNPQLCNLSVLAKGLVSRLQPLAQERRIRLQIQGTGFAQVDLLELERALYNLIDNALRHARSEVDVEICLPQIRIRDDGPGLPASLEALAQPYTAERVEIAGQRFFSRSSGLGLFISRRIIEAHGGELQVVQTGASGTTLALCLPPQDSWRSEPPPGL